MFAFRTKSIKRLPAQPSLRGGTRTNLDRLERQEFCIAPIDRRLQGLVVIVPRGDIAVDIDRRLRLGAEVLHLLQTQRADRLELFLIVHGSKGLGVRD